MKKLFFSLLILLLLSNPVSANTDNVGDGNFYIEQIKNSLISISGVFDNFISFTPDPTGLSSCSLGEDLSCSIASVPASDFNLPSGNILLPATNDISDKLSLILIPLAVIFLTLEALEMLSNKDGRMGGIFKRLLLALVLLIIMPYLISLSILMINYLSHVLLSGNSLTSFIVHFTEQLEASPSQNIFEEFFTDILQALDPGGANPFSYIAALPVMVPLSLIFILLLFISFQFIIRFLGLYFLSAIYPAIVLALLYERSANLLKNYIRIWLTFLMQQPVFIIGFVLVKDVLYSIFDQGLSFEALIIFVGMLLFLSSINLFTAKMWGDPYVAVTQNVSAALATHIIKSNLIDKPIKIGTSLLNKGRGPTFSPKDMLDPVEKLKHTNDKNPHNSIKSRSLLYNDLNTRGYLVKDLDDGRLSVSGRFYGDGSKGRNIAKLYTSMNDARQDGLRDEQIRQYELAGLRLQDPSNIKGIKGYNSRIKTFAAENNGHWNKGGISYRSQDDKIVKTMEYGKYLNMQKGVQAIATNSDTQTGDRSIKSDNLLKIHIYGDVLNRIK